MYRASALLICVIAWSGTLFAWRSPCCSDFEAGVDILYVRPTCPATRLVAIEDDQQGGEIPEDSVPQGRPLELHRGSSVGFRAFLGFVNKLNCYDLRAEYLQVHQHHSRDPVEDITKDYWVLIGGEARLLRSTATEPLKMKSFFHHDVNAFDVSLGRRCMLWRRLWIRPFVSLHYASLLDHFEVAYLNRATEAKNNAMIANTLATYKAAAEATNLDSSQRSAAQAQALAALAPDLEDPWEYLLARQRGWLLGPRLGAQGILSLVRGWGVSAQGSFGMLFGACHRNFTSIKCSHPFIAAPSVDLRLGLAYRICELPCFSAMVEVGYEYLAYYNALRGSHTTVSLRGGYVRVWLSL